MHSEDPERSIVPYLKQIRYASYDWGPVLVYDKPQLAERAAYFNYNT